MRDSRPPLPPLATKSRSVAADSTRLLATAVACRTESPSRVGGCGGMLGGWDGSGGDVVVGVGSGGGLGGCGGALMMVLTGVAPGGS